VNFQIFTFNMLITNLSTTFLIISVNLQPVERVYEEDNTKLITHILINCPFCKDSFIYEMGLMYHMLRNHFPPNNDCKKYIAINEVHIFYIK